MKKIIKYLSLIMIGASTVSFYCSMFAGNKALMVISILVLGSSTTVFVASASD